MRHCKLTVMLGLTLVLLASCGGGSPQALAPPGSNPAPVPTGPDTTPPDIVSVTGLDGDSLSGAVQLQIQATDNVAVAQVRLYVDGVFVASAAGNTMGYLWQTAGLTDGDHSVVVAAVDTAGNGRQNTYGVVLANDNPAGGPLTGQHTDAPGAPDLSHAADPTDKFPPNSIVTSGLPADGVIWDTVHFTVFGLDNKAVWWMEVRFNGGLVASGSGPTLNVTWDPEHASEGPQQLEVLVYDRGANLARSWITLTVDHSIDHGPPAIPLNFPRFITVTGATTIKYDFIEDKHMASIVVEKDGQEIYRVSDTKHLVMPFNSLGYPDGVYLLSYILTDGTGALARASQFVHITNHPAGSVTGRILAPNGQDPVAGATVRMPMFIDSGAPDYGIPDKKHEQVDTGYFGANPTLATDAAGRFTIHGVPPGPRRLTVATPGVFGTSTYNLDCAVSGDYALSTAEGTLPASGAARFTVVSGDSERVQDLLAKLGYGVTNSNGGLVLGSEKFGLVDGNAGLPANYPDLPALLESPARLEQCDVIFICAGDHYEADLATHPVWRANLAAWFQAGKTNGRPQRTLYCGGSAYDFIAQYFPESLRFRDGLPAGTQPVPLNAAEAYTSAVSARLDIGSQKLLTDWLGGLGYALGDPHAIVLPLPAGWVGTEYNPNIGWQVNLLDLPDPAGGYTPQSRLLAVGDTHFYDDSGHWQTLGGQLIHNACPVCPIPAAALTVTERILQFWLYSYPR